MNSLVINVGNMRIKGFIAPERDVCPALSSPLPSLSSNGPLVSVSPKLMSSPSSLITNPPFCSPSLLISNPQFGAPSLGNSNSLFLWLLRAGVRTQKMIRMHWTFTIIMKIIAVALLVDFISEIWKTFGSDRVVDNYNGNLRYTIYIYK